MKKLLSILLAIGILLSVCACNGNDSSTSDAVNEDATEETEKVLSDEEQIIANVMKLMKDSDEQEDPASLLSHFDGDYEISNVTKSNEPIKSIKRKNAVAIFAYNSYNCYYVEAAGNLFVVYDRNGDVTDVSHLPLQADAPSKSTVFTTFGIDTSAIYGTEAESDSIELTEEMLTVSEDKTACTFSKEYLDDMATTLCESLSYNNSQIKTFLSKYKGSGEYSVSDNKITFDISFKDTTLGNIHQITSYAVDKDGKVNASSYMEYSNPKLGIKTPLVTEINYKDVVYQDNNPISANIQVKNTSDTSFYEGSVYIQSTTSTVSTFQLDCSKENAPKCVASYERTGKETVLGDTNTWKEKTTVTVDLGKTSGQFTFSNSYDGEVNYEIRANKITFSTPASFPSVPQRVTDAITLYIKNEM